MAKKKSRFLVSIVLMFLFTNLFAQSSSKVYVTAKGKKYHTATCRTVQNSATTELTKEDAVKAGYEACKICKP